MALQRNPYEGDMGLVVQRLVSEEGVLSEEVMEVLYDEHLFLRSAVAVRDLNADGVDDWVFVGGKPAVGPWGVCRVGWGLAPNPRRGEASLDWRWGQGAARRC